VTFAGFPAVRGAGAKSKLMIGGGLGLALAAGPATATADTGGLAAGSPASIAGVTCLKSCVAAGDAQPGSVVRVRGRELSDAGRVVFLGRPGSDDDASAGVRHRDARSTYVDVKVPTAARTGPVLVLDRADGSSSQPSPTGITIDHGVDPRGPGSVNGGGVIAKLESRVVYFAGKRGQRLAYSLTGSKPTPVRVDLVRVSDGSVTQTWGPTSVAPGSTQTIAWKGDTKAGDSRYQFQVYTGPAATSPAAPPSATAGARSAQATAPSVADSFLYLQHIFPIRGAHNYGDAQNRYGAPRSGHRHAGQDVLAKCGTPLVAARGGRVTEAGYEGGGGNAVVIHGTGSNYDNVYMHLRDPPLVHTGQRVFTGQLIGFVGETGDASVCHLHFELWQGAWFNGGHTVDPLPTLRAWDALS
jgi:hypothetical protein